MNNEERKANYFARKLLMPEKMVRKYWKITKDVSIMADLFMVPEREMLLKLKEVLAKEE